MMNYGEEVFGNTTVAEKIFNKDQILNSCDSYVFQASDMAILDRFLIMGTEGGTYYTNQKMLTLDCAETILKIIKSSKENAISVVNRAVEISLSGRASKNEPAIFVLAMVASFGEDEARKYALDNMHKVCRIGTHLFYFLEIIKPMRGWGRGIRTAVSNWYRDRDLDSLVNQVLKYKNRHGWTHKDAIAKSHTIPATPEQGYIFETIFNAEAFSKPIPTNSMAKYYTGANFAKIVGNDVKRAVNLIKTYDFPREIIPTHMLNEPEIWDALIDNNMGYTALIRNLGKMNSIGYISTNNSNNLKVINLLTNAEKIKGSRVHPITILQAKMVYENNRGIKGSLNWRHVKSIADALEEAFYLSFDNVESTNKRHMVAIDVSYSMTARINNSDILTSSVITGAMAMSIVKKEKMYDIMGFDSHFKPLNISKHSSLSEVYNTIVSNTFGDTNCSIPMEYARQNKIPVDVFSIWTDNETNYGNHPCVELKKYRDAMGIDAKLIVCATASNGFSIADPHDKNMLDVVGFDSSVPSIIHDFSMDII